MMSAVTFGSSAITGTESRRRSRAGAFTTQKIEAAFVSSRLIFAQDAPIFRKIFSNPWHKNESFPVPRPLLSSRFPQCREGHMHRKGSDHRKRYLRVRR